MTGATDPAERMDTILTALAHANGVALANSQAIRRLTYGVILIGVLLIAVLVHKGGTLT